MRQDLSTVVIILAHISALSNNPGVGYQLYGKWVLIIKIKNSKTARNIRSYDYTALCFTYRHGHTCRDVTPGFVINSNCTNSLIYFT